MTQPSEDQAQGSRSSPGTAPPVRFSPSPRFAGWLAEERVSLAFTTYQTGKLFFIGLGPDGRLSAFERSLERCAGLAAGGQSLFVATLYQIWRFENALRPGQESQGYDRLYVPQMSSVTGDVDAHDLALDGKGQPVFVNTACNCLARPRDTHSFQPIWRPPFISELTAEDRCHLNGLAMRDGAPAYVTAVSQSDVASGWRERRHDGGCVMDVAANQVIADGLSMPHSPRWHALPGEAGRLWLHNSGTGEFGFLTPGPDGPPDGDGRFEPVCFCPGYLRGLAMFGPYAVMGLSKPRDRATFGGLPLDKALADRGAEARCALQVVDLRSGDCLHWLRMEGLVSELYDVAVLPGVRRPMAIGFKGDEIRRVLTLP